MVVFLFLPAHAMRAVGAHLCRNHNDTPVQPAECLGTVTTAARSSWTGHPWVCARQHIFARVWLALFWRRHLCVRPRAAVRG